MNSTPRTTPNRYDPLTRLLHWGMFFLLLAVCALVELHEIFPKGSSGRTAMMALHMSLGVIALIMVLPRLGWRVVQALRGALPDESAMPGWQRLASKAMYLAFYLLLLALPVSGYLGVALDARSVDVFGLFTLPPIGAGDHNLAHDLKEVHETLANVFIALVGLHFAAALWHHFGLRDDVLLRMK
ncbi:cytochrome b [Rhodocyclus tenuis]|uniref:Cytochrome b561 n=1 Tax=Rhodocyclus tenuis TaxID=1066 RepID=A0A840GCT1_RHOTE|nr:cytochrome b [Rhodocyclus tenuis]MBB4248448.1 cytochrome b561 [Rhodocyclus tenuis]